MPLRRPQLGSKEEALRRIPLLQSLGRADLQQLARMTEELVVEPGKVVCREGGTAREFFFIAEGEAEVTKGGEHVRRLAGGDLFGEIASVEHLPRAVTMKALTPLRLCVVSSHGFWSVIRRQPAVERDVLRTLVFENMVVRQIAEAALRRQAEMNAHQALHDPLTGLPNRTLFHDRIEQAILASRRSREGAAVLVMDLDRFKEINDTLGHQAGDALLTELGARLGSVLRESDTVARLGGDEFGVLLPGQSGQAAGLAPAIERIREAIEEPFVVEGLALEVETSIGVALYPDHGDDVAALLQRADVAMYQAKDANALYSVYDAAKDQHSLERLTLVGDLRRAIDERQLVLHYQPMAALGSNRIKSVEALLRWTHPDRGFVPPDQFVPLAEQTGLIKRLTYYVLDEALRQCRTWRDEGLDVAVSVNISMRNLVDVRFPNEVGALLQQHGIDPSRLELEITESAMLADPFRVKQVLDRLSGMGICLSIDDFGTGFSSLAYLKRLPVNEIKIDRSFVTNMLENEEDAVIVRSTIDLGRNLGLNVVAEGVENEETWDTLRALGCHTAQGYYLSRPTAGDALTEWLRTQPGAAAEPQVRRPAA